MGFQVGIELIIINKKSQKKTLRDNFRKQKN